MNEQTKKRCEQLIENRDRIRTVFGWDSGLIHLACAGVYTAKGKRVDVDKLRDSKNLLNQSVGAFSNFRGTARAPIVAMLAASGNAEQMMERALKVYGLLKKEFFSSTYLPLAAMVIAQMAKPYEYEKIAARTKSIYKDMKDKHPVLTSSEDSAFCALLALSTKTDEELLEDMEACYQILKQQFSSWNAVQSLSHVLALCEGSPEEKCNRTMDLFEKLKAAGHKYGTGYELLTLGALAMSGEDQEALVSEMVEIDEWLAAQKGFGIFGSVTRKQRLMYAGILAQKEDISEEMIQTATLNGTISFIIAQEMAICAAIAASSAAAASSTSD